MSPCFMGGSTRKEAELVYANAGHCYPLLFRRNGEVDRLIVGGPVIGFFQRFLWRSEKRLSSPEICWWPTPTDFLRRRARPERSIEEERIIRHGT